MPITKTELPVEVQAIVRKISEGYDPDRIIVFGSYARGTQGKGSDLDVLVVKETTARWTDRVRAVSGLVTPRRVPMDIIVRTPAEVEEALRHRELFMRQVMEEGVVAYERQ